MCNLWPKAREYGTHSNLFSRKKGNPECMLIKFVPLKNIQKMLIEFAGLYDYDVSLKHNSIILAFLGKAAYRIGCFIISLFYTKSTLKVQFMTSVSIEYHLIEVSEKYPEVCISLAKTPSNQILLMSYLKLSQHLRS